MAPLVTTASPPDNSLNLVEPVGPYLTCTVERRFTFSAGSTWFEEIGFHRRWAIPTPLAAALEQANRDTAMVVASSEGALFEYGSDDQILANLVAFRDHAPAGSSLVGAVLKDKETLPDGLQWIGAGSGIAVRLLGLRALQDLAAKAGWDLAPVEDGPIHHIVVLERRGSREKLDAQAAALQR